MPYYDKEVYENGSAKLEVTEGVGVWLGCGIAGVYLNNEEFDMMWPLLEAYAGERKVANES